MAVSGLIFVLMSQLLLQFLKNSLKHDLGYLLFAHHTKEYFKHVDQNSLMAIYFNILKKFFCI